MAILTLDGATFECRVGETVLESLERGGVSVASSCRVGVCQSCMLRAVDGTPPADSQKGLPPNLVAQNYFLSCCAKPTHDLAIEIAAARPARVAVVDSIAPLNDTIVRLRCTPGDPFDYFAGQFMNIVGPSNAIRSYSIASVCGVDPWLEFHVGLMKNGIVSSWIHHELAPGDRIEFRGPQGDCFYLPGKPEQPLLLAGTGTGLAPLVGILRDALHHGHRAPIKLFHGSLRADGLYLVDELRAMAEQHENLSYFPCLLQEEAPGIPQKPIDGYVEEIVPDLSGHRVFLCGHPDLVRTMQRDVFLAGADMTDILADAFLPAASS